MQPFINPYLFTNQYPGMQPGMNFQNNNNYIQPAQGMAGKYVNDFSEITANDVPMGSQPAIFIKNDRSEIQLREWSPNGQIVSNHYIPFVPKKEEQTAAPALDINAQIIDPILQRLSELEDKIEKLNKPASVSRNKKDGE